MRRSIFISAASAAMLLLAGCVPQVTGNTGTSTTSGGGIPPCEGSATSEYGLGDAVRSSIAELGSLPVRFSTGEATVTATDTGLVVFLRLCGPGADLDATRDAASSVARSVAKSESLGTKVQVFRVENPNESARIVATPFEAERFEATGTLTSLRGQWRTETQGN